jgi:cysteine desulfurase/selenocysteine lyase
MSTNIENKDWSDAAGLEQLANELFKAPPGGGVSPAAALSGSVSPAIAQLGGVSPAAALPGSGISPAAAHRKESFDINDPQSSLPDPHFEDGKVPVAVAGSGRQPSLQEAPASSSSHAWTSAPSSPMTDVLSQIASFSVTPQIPYASSVESPYYFLRESSSPLARPAQLPAGLIQPPFDVAAVKNDFPILKEYVNGRQLVWLDNAATTQKPQQVIDRISHFYRHENSNIHRAAHELAARATDAYEDARKKVQQFLNAGSAAEIVFVRGATEGINLVAKSWGEQYLSASDEIIVSHLEHHANIVPWQQLAAKKGCKLKVIPVDEDGQVLLDEYARLLSGRTKLVAITQVSNALGTVVPVKQIAAMAHAAGAKVLVDGAQSVSHMRVDVRDIDADWFIFSGHKVFAPTGIGVVYGKEALLNETQPWQGGGNMIKDVTFEHTQYQNAPGRFEAGTGNIADAVGLGAAIDYVSRLGMDNIGAYEHYLLIYGTRLLKNVPGLRLIGTAANKASVLSFVLDGFTNDQVGQALNKEGIAVRTGHHCAQPILRRFGLESTVRPSLAFYNTCADVDALVNVLYKLRSGR